MARVDFHEAPGCAGNAEQNAWLVAAGYELVARKQLAEAWTPAMLRPCLAGMPIES